MIVTVTLNPSLDRTIEVDALVRGTVHRAGPVRLDAGGKGVNVARALSANGLKARAVLPTGGRDGEALAALLVSAGIDHVAVPIREGVRTNVSVVEPDGTVTKLNTPGPLLGQEELEACLSAILAACADTGWVACSGSLPPGVPADVYARLTTALHAAGCAVAIDTSGEALSAALPARPDLVKPNLEELSAVVGRPLATLGEAVAAAREVHGRGAGAVLCSLGADGALLVDARDAVHGEAAVEAVASTVGAGDAMLAGFLAAGGRGRDALCEALAWGAAAVQLPGSRMPEPGDVRRAAVTLHAGVDPDRRLRDS
jgi:1-phosphofructokinase